MPEERIMKKNISFFAGKSKKYLYIASVFYLERVKFVVWVFTSDSFS